MTWVGPSNHLGVRVVEADTTVLRLEEMDVRLAVFVGEQHVPLVLEIDAVDFRADVTHLVAVTPEGDVLGTVRLIPDASGTFHLGRLAVRQKARKLGVGALLVEAIRQLVAERTPVGSTATVLLDAQVSAIGFYEKQGYTLTSGPLFLDAGIEHRTMSHLVDGTQTR